MTSILICTALLFALWLSQKFARVWWFERQKYPLPPDLYVDDVLCPVDGTVVYVKRANRHALEVVKQGKLETVYDVDGDIDDPGTLVGIYMSPFDRHSIMAPVNGLCAVLGHLKTGRNLPMLDLLEYVRFAYFGKLVAWGEKQLFGFIAQNEKVCLMVGGITLVGIADRFVDKIDVFKSGEYVARGELVAHIRRGSQTDLFIPDDYGTLTTRLEPGQRVKAGQIIGRRKHA